MVLAVLTSPKMPQLGPGDRGDGRTAPQLAHPCVEGRGGRGRARVEGALDPPMSEPTRVCELSIAWCFTLYPNTWLRFPRAGPVGWAQLGGSPGLDGAPWGARSQPVSWGAVSSHPHRPRSRLPEAQPGLRVQKQESSHAPRPGSVGVGREIGAVFEDQRPRRPVWHGV